MDRTSSGMILTRSIIDFEPNLYFVLSSATTRCYQVLPQSGTFQDSQEKCSRTPILHILSNQGEIRPDKQSEDDGCPEIAAAETTTSNHAMRCDRQLFFQICVIPGIGVHD